MLRSRQKEQKSHFFGCHLKCWLLSKGVKSTHDLSFKISSHSVVSQNFGHLSVASKNIVVWSPLSVSLAFFSSPELRGFVVNVVSPITWPKETKDLGTRMFKAPLSNLVPRVSHLPTPAGAVDERPWERGWPLSYSVIFAIEKIMIHATWDNYVIWRGNYITISDKMFKQATVDNPAGVRWINSVALIGL